MSEEIEDSIVDVTTAELTRPGKNTKLIRGIKSPALAYNGSQYRGSFKASDYNLSDIANATDRESMVSRAVNKIKYLVWKNGYDLVGDSPKSVGYLKERFRQIAMVSKIPTAILFRDITEQLVTYHNAYVVKARKIEASGGMMRTTFYGKELEPVAAYFPVCATTVQIDKDEYGNVRSYRQVVPGYPKSKWPVFQPEDVIHFYMNRKVGLSTGTPFIIPVLDDIRALRNMEENIERLVHKHSIPLLHYKVGTDLHPAKPDEIETLQWEIERMPESGGIATSHRYEIKSVGVEGQALDASKYLEYFLKRVRGGLHLSSVDWGEGDSSSRGTSLTMSQDTRDTVEEYQDIIKIFINDFVIEELLMEGGFFYDSYDMTNKVELFIPEIDLDATIKRENHITNLYQSELITEDEARTKVGLEPLKDEQRKKMFLDVVTLPTLKMKGAVSANGAVKAADMPSNQHGTQLVRPRITSDDIVDAYSAPNLLNVGFNQMNVLLEEQWRQYRKEIVHISASGGRLKDLWEEGTINIFTDTAQKLTDRFIPAAYMIGEDSIQALLDSAIEYLERESDINEAKEMTTHSIKKLYMEAAGKINRLNDFNRPEAEALLDAMDYRVPSIVATSLMRAKNYGKARYLQLSGKDTLTVPGCCEHAEKKIPIGSGIDLKALPPHHPNCVCEVA